MNKLTTALCFSSIVSLLMPVLTLAQPTQQPVDWVNPMIGASSGSTFPGATLPYGMVKVGPDAAAVKDWATAGYKKNRPICGFSHLHESGTGGAPEYGNILVCPVTGPPSLRDSSMMTDIQASPGYFSGRLTKPNVLAELTATRHAALHRYTFAPGTTHAGILIDAGHFLDCEDNFERQRLVGSQVEVVSPTEVQGYTRVRGGWNIGSAYTVYFYAVLDQPASSQSTWTDATLMPGQRTQIDAGKPTGIYLRMGTPKGGIVRMKVGISFLSEAKARANLLAELPDWNLDAIRQQARTVWNSELSRVAVQGGTDEQKRMFYSSLYFTMLLPSDRTGENPKWTSAEPYYDDFYTLWDTFRATDPLRTLIDPAREVAIARSLIDTWRHDGYMPDGRSGNENGRTQGGSNADVVLADLYVKGIKGLDYEQAYKAMVHDAEVPPGGYEQKEGRGGLLEYKRLGYVPTDRLINEYTTQPPQLFVYERAGSRTLEYANCDFGLATVAKGLGKTDDYQKYRQRAGNWKNLWRPLTAEGITGFVWPRRNDGSWVDGYVLKSFGSFGNFFYESSSWEYSLFVPHDVKALIAQCGGPAQFVARLDTVFAHKHFAITNEPGFLIPCLYNYVGQPHRTAERIHTLIRQHFHPTPEGLPGDDDAGSMTAWFAFHAMGFFPVTGQDVYLISTPLFAKSTINLPEGRQFTVEARNLTEQNKYVQSATLNGKPLNQSWFRHTAIAGGGSLVLTMGDKPSDWGREKLPPSMSDKN